mgnify:FL=1
MKIIFLDLDGVLNNWYHPDLIDSKNVLVLKKIIKLTNAKIVLTTSNKYPFQREKIKNIKGSYLEKYIKILQNNGLSIYDLTPYVEENRSLEIKAYLKSNPNITDFVIIDDEIISLKLLKYQVFLDWNTGLLEKHIKPIIAILNGQLGFYPPDYDIQETNEQRLIRINKYYNR